MDIRRMVSGVLPGKKREKESPDARRPSAPRARVVDRSLIINCSRCRYSPDPETAECIRCMVRCMSSAGSSDRVVLRTGKDVEISGRSGRAIRDVASVMRWSLPQEEPKGRCRMCDLSRGRIVSAVWDVFPSDGAPDAHVKLQGRRPPGKECEACVIRTRRAIEQIEAGLKEATDRMSAPAGGRARCQGPGRGSRSARRTAR